MSWVYLSYPLNDRTFAYGNGDRFKSRKVRSICCGDTSNNSEFSMPAHFGTHIDYPYHFSEEGKTSSAYSAGDFVFTRVAIIELEGTPLPDSYLIRNGHLSLSGIDPSTECLIIKTGFAYRRQSDEYWEKGFGFHPETAAFLKSNLPSLRAIAFDLISLSSFQERPVGREAHKQFLLENDILIIEDLDLRTTGKNSRINMLVVAPLQLENADGSPCTVLAQTEDD